MHIHMRIMKDGRNMMLTPERTLSVEARKAIAGMMDLAQSITAFCAQEKIVGSRPPNRVRNCVTDLEKTDR